MTTIKKTHQPIKEDWINRKWRPLMAVQYMIVCGFDFVILPIFWGIIQAYTHGQVASQWQPLTLQGAGLYHIAMGAIIGVTAYGRTKEKMAGVGNQLQSMNSSNSGN